MTARARRRLWIRWVVVLPGAAILVWPGRFQWPTGTEVIDTVHNLSRTATVDPMSDMIVDYGSACVYCHSPHGGGIDGPVWNRQLFAGPFRMYDSGSLDMVMDAQPAGISAVCLSCHEGSIGLDEVINPPTAYAGPAAIGEVLERCADDCHTGGNPDGGLNWENVLFTDDMRDQHPISILYDPSMDPNFLPIGAVESAGIRFFAGKVECASCHDPHSQANQPFLRVPNAGGSMCSVCHLGPTGESTAHFW